MCITPKKASTVSIIKNNSGKMEVLLMRRHLHDRFLPDYFVFPGGALDNQDFDYQYQEKENSIVFKDFDGSSRNYYGHVLCGIRETFEESGFLFAVNENGEYPHINTKDEIDRFSLYRKLVFENKMSFRDMLIKEKLTPTIDRFYYINRWITPALFPIRYDARFFAAIAPENQEISFDGDELVEFQWMTPEDALHRFSTSKIKMVMPTIKTLEFLNKFKSAEDVILQIRG